MDWHARTLNDGCEVSDSEMNDSVRGCKIILPCCDMLQRSRRARQTERCRGRPNRAVLGPLVLSALPFPLPTAVVVDVPFLCHRTRTYQQCWMRLPNADRVIVRAGGEHSLVPWVPCDRVDAAAPMPRERLKQ